MLRLGIVLVGLLMIAFLPIGSTGSLGLETVGGVDRTDDDSGFATVFDFGFEDGDTETPVTVIGTGDSVLWLWTSGIHTVTHGVEDATNVVPPAFDSGVKSSSDVEPFFSASFNTPGVYEYFCTLHPTMRGVVVVA